MFTTKRKFKGPWLLSKSAVGELDQLLEETEESLNRHNREQFQKASSDPAASNAAGLRSRNRREPPNFKWVVQITLHGDGEVRGRSFADCARKLRGTAEVPRAAEVEIGSYEYGRLRLRINSRFGEDGLEIEVPPDVENRPSFAVGEDFVASASEWALRHQSPLPLRLWADDFFWLRLGVLTAAGFSVVPIVIAVKGDRQKNAATHLLRDGISPEEVPAALELLLRNAYSVAPDASPPIYHSVGFWVAATAVLVLIALGAKRPQTILELNTAATKALRFDVAWTRFWIWGAPLWVALTLLTLAIEQWIWPALR